jgi:formylglycine-generating enzyme required for sulfatase activity
LLLVSRLGGATALDAASGKLRWEHKETWSQATAIPSISVGDGTAIVPSMNKGGSFALRLESTPTVAWRASKASTQYSSPLIHDGRVYWVNGVGALFCTDLKTGEDLWAHRLPGSVWASPVVAGGRLYFTTGEGVTVVIAAGPELKVLATNSLPVNGTVYGVAVAEGGLFLRTLNQLWRVAPHSAAPVIRTRIETAPAAVRLPPVAPETEKIFRKAGSKAGESRPHPKIGSPYAWIPAGTFRMGCSEGDTQCAPDEKPSREVRISRGFWMAVTETTTADYLRFAKGTGRPVPAEPKLQTTALNPGHANTKFPITNVTWDDAVQFCRWVGGRLPTEAEWEHAARASSPASRYGVLDRIAWYGDNSGRERIDTTAILAREREKYLVRQAENGNSMHPVGTKEANAWGLHDMLGNVWEWTSDGYHPYPATPATDPRADEESDRMAARGGSWQFFPARITHSVRMRYRPDTTNESLGFRCIQDIP